MLSQEKGHLSQLIVYEAAKRYIWSLEMSGRASGEQKYRFIENLSSAIEKTELSFCTRARFFDNDKLQLEKVQQSGYVPCEAYNWLSLNASLEGQYEMCTTLNEQDERVKTVVRSMQDCWVNEHQPAPEEETQMD